MKTVGRWWLVVGAWLVLTASVVGVYRLGRLHGQIAAIDQGHAAGCRVHTEGAR